jgi:hypothetical protein
VALVRPYVLEECRGYVPVKFWFLKEPYCFTSQKMEFFIVTDEKTSNLTLMYLIFYLGMEWN